MESFTAFEYAVASTAGVIKGMLPGQADEPTPCSEWDVRALLSHVIGTLWLAEALFTDRAPRYPMAPGGLPAVDLGSDDPVAAAGVGDALTRMHVPPLGEMPGPVLAGFTTLDVAVHGWDLAMATGQPADLDGRLAAHVLAFAEQAITPATR